MEWQNVLGMCTKAAPLSEKKTCP